MRKFVLAVAVATGASLGFATGVGAQGHPPTGACAHGTATAHENIPHSDAPGTHVAHATVPHC